MIRCARQQVLAQLEHAFSSQALLLEHGVVDAEKSSDSRARQDTLVATIDGSIDACNGLLAEPATECDALPVYNKRHQSLHDAEGQRIHDVVRGGVGVSSDAASWLVGCRQVEEVASKSGQDGAGEQPGERRRPEGRGKQQEQVGNMDRAVIGSQEADGRDGEGIAVGQDFGAQEVELEY